MPRHGRHEIMCLPHTRYFFFIEKIKHRTKARSPTLETIYTPCTRMEDPIGLLIPHASPSSGIYNSPPKKFIWNSKGAKKRAYTSFPHSGRHNYESQLYHCYSHPSTRYSTWSVYSRWFIIVFYAFFLTWHVSMLHILYAVHNACCIHAGELGMLWAIQLDGVLPTSSRYHRCHKGVCALPSFTCTSFPL